jgi:endo-1,4-beta-xylanase
MIKISALLVLALATVCARFVRAQTVATTQPTLRQLAGGRVLIGTAIMASDLREPRFAQILTTQFNCITPGNELKPDFTQRSKGTFTFDGADQIAAFAQQHNMKMIGHTLLWHSQTPQWMFQADDGSPLPREQALENLRNHITTVVQHYRGKLVGWDVCNEAIADGGAEDLRATPGRRAIGDDYIIQAFKIAREADPNVQLYYNDYSIEQTRKRERTIRLLKQLQAAGVRLDAVGIQGHWMIGAPDPKVVDDAITEYAALGIKVMITEMDIDPLPRRGAGADIAATEAGGANPYKDGLPAEIQQRLGDRYAAFFKVFVKHIKAGNLTRVTLWGLDDGHTWLNDFPVRGRTNHPLLFDREYRPKPALDATLRVMETLEK